MNSRCVRTGSIYECREVRGIRLEFLLAAIDVLASRPR